MHSALRCVTVVVFGTVILGLPWPGKADDWSQFRGPEGNGVTSAVHPATWSDEENRAWTTEIPGGGWSSPVLTAGSAFVTAAVSSDLSRPMGFGAGVSSMRSFYQSKPPQEAVSFEVHRISLADGSIQWTKQIVARKPPYKIHPSNSYATESPVTDGKRVYVNFAAVGVVACVSLDGELVWQRDLGSYPTANDFGTSSSLAMHDGRVFVQCDNEDQSFICSLDAETGDDLWRVERRGGTSWSSPVVWKNRSRTELVACGSGAVTSYDPASGSVLWNLTGTGGAFSASPTSNRDMIFFGNSGRNSRGPLIAVNAGAVGELTLDSVGDRGLAWVQERSAPGMCSPVVVMGRLYVLSRGILSCHDSDTGQRLFRQRLSGASSVTSSLWASGGKVFALSESGQTTVIKVGDQFELLGSNQTDGLYWSTPSIAGSSLLLRSASSLICVREDTTTPARDERKVSLNP